MTPPADAPHTAPTDRTADAQRPAGVVLMNGAAGRDRSREETARIEALIRERTDLEVRLLESGTDLARAAEEAAAQGHGMVVAAGGDGTISQVCAALAGSGTRLGVLPMGTFNFFARSLAIPEDIESAIEVLTHGRERSLTLGRINDCLFINNASLGAYAAVLEARESIYARWGRSRLAAYWSVLVAMLTLYRPLRMVITVDGERQVVRSPMAFFAVRAYQLREYALAGDDQIEAGKVALYLAPDDGRVALLWRTFKILLRLVRPGEDYRLITGREIVVETAARRQTVAHDGERAVMAAPYRVRMLPDALSVMVPGEETPPA